MFSNTKLSVVVGGQYGSEAKGHVTQRVAERAHEQGLMPHTVRVAGPNAGHTGYDRHGHPWALRQVPVAAVVPGQATLGIAAGSEIDLDVLFDELKRLRIAGLLDDKTVWVSEEATIITDQHKAAEVGRMASESETNLVKRIGSTGKGIGAARADRAMRTAHRLIDRPEAVEMLKAYDVIVTPPETLPHYTAGQHLIIEGTQGYGLGLHAGFYPQCTSSNCRATDFLAMANVSPWDFRAEDVTIWVVARIYPIRVAGNSGPLKDETSWAELGLPEEKTTVTQKIRRVGGPDWPLVRRAVNANGRERVKVALTMLDQKFPIMSNQGLHHLPAQQAREVAGYIKSVEEQVDAPIGLYTTGPNAAFWRTTSD